MKYCEKCGHEMVDEAVICTACGCSCEEKKAVSKNNAIWSLVLGIISIGAAWLMALFGYITSIPAIILGFQALKRSNGNNKNIAIAAIVAGIIGLICSIINSIMGILLYSGAIL